MYMYRAHPYQPHPPHLSCPCREFLPPAHPFRYQHGLVGFVSCSEKSAAGFDLSGVIASEANFSKGDFKEVVMSKAYARVGQHLSPPLKMHDPHPQKAHTQLPIHSLWYVMRGILLHQHFHSQN